MTAETAAASEPRTALVTGASSGFGAAVARAFGGLGWRVALGARRADRLAEAAREVEKAGGVPFAHFLDVSDAGSIEAFVTAAEEALGPLEVVVSNAGTSLPGLLHEIAVDDLRAELDTNLFGPMVLARRVLPGLLARRRGDLVFVSSQNAVLPRPLQAGYSAAKAGLEALARVLQMELEGTGIRATVVRPGASKTGFGWDWDKLTIQRILRSWKHWGLLRHHRYLSPENVAAAVVSVVTAPPGVHWDLVQVNPEGPLQEEISLP